MYLLLGKSMPVTSLYLEKAKIHVSTLTDECFRKLGAVRFAYCGIYRSNLTVLDQN